MASEYSKTQSLLICSGSYIIVLLICLLIYLVIDFGKPILNTLILDLFATCLIFGISYSFNNSSFYDPYWSVAPVPILIYWIISSNNEVNIRQVFILTIVLIWSIRLTVNWIRRWKGIRDEDWRYVNFRKIFPRFYWLISFSGIHLLPTIVVFLACISVFPALVDKSGNLDLFDGLGTTISFIAILIETLSDEQLKRFLENSKGQSFLRTGLWKYSRHPNYFGEVLFWIGIFLFSQGHESFYWWTLPGPIVMIALFHFISVPMIDKRMISRKPGYEQYFKETSGWIPWFPKGR